MTRVALYARYSSDNQRDASIEDQFRICKERAIREKRTIVSSYKDVGISGASIILRPGIQALLQDAQPRVPAIGRIHQRDAAWQIALAGPADLLQRELRLGLELDLLRHACLLSPGTILRPGFRQVQPIGHRKAGGMIGNRQRHLDLAIGLLPSCPQY
jgi:hypothetical protein